MSSNSTPPLTEKEIKEVYNYLNKERLIEILIEKTLEIRKLREENMKLMMKL